MFDATAYGGVKRGRCVVEGYMNQGQLVMVRHEDGAVRTYPKSYFGDRLTHDPS